MSEIEILCNQRRVEIDYDIKFIEVLEGKGFVNKKYYYKKVDGNRSKYLFPDGFQDEEGTFFVDLDNERAKYLDDKLDFCKRDYSRKGLDIGMIGGGLMGLIAGSIISYYAISGSSDPTFNTDNFFCTAILTAITTVIGAVVGATFGTVGGGITNIFKDVSDTNKIEEYLHNGRRSEQKFDYNIIREAIGS
ncbi:hypothetical protein ACFL1H_05050 [Nanoarchaeota archaeon]